MICWMTVADDYLTEVGPELDAWDREYAETLLESVADVPAPVREALVLHSAAHPVIPLLIRFAAGRRPGNDLAEDVDWVTMVAFARREEVAHRAAGLDAGMGEENLGLLDRISSLVESWPEPEWGGAIRQRVQELVDARRRGRERGLAMRPGREGGESSTVPTAGWLLCHPGDHYFRRARTHLTDSRLLAGIDAWTAAFAPSYGALAGEDWSAQETRADLVAEVEVGEPVPLDWRQPIEAVVLASDRCSASAGATISLRQVADPDAQFNGLAIELLAGERWLTCASALGDGTFLPEDGTRRTAAPDPS
jgi:hypothetical protein